MAKDTVSSEKAKKQEHNSFTGRTICTRSSASSGPTPQETSGPRQSSREIPLKKASPLQSSTRKSERLETQSPSTSATRKSERLQKDTPSPPSVTRKSERIEKKNAPSPLRRSDRGKIVCSLNSLGTRKSARISGASPDIDQRKHKKEKSVEELTSKIRKCRPMTARAYRALYIRQPKRSEYLAEQHGNKDNDTYKVDGNDSDRISGKYVAETIKQVGHEDPLEEAVSPSTHSIRKSNHAEEASASPHDEEASASHVASPHDEEVSASPHDEGAGVAVTSLMADDENDGAEKVGSECQRLKISEPLNVVIDLTNDQKDDDSPLKLKRNITEMVPDAPAMVVNGDGCIMRSDRTITSTSECNRDDHPKTCNRCQKRQKVNHDSPKLANCSCITKPDQESDCAAQDEGGAEAAAGKGFGETNEQFIGHDESHDSKADSSSYPEYWVPVQISDIQLEQYCATLLSNSLPLCSLLKNDPVNALHNTFISARKTCDHPYLVDESVQTLLTKNVEVAKILDVGIKASGKLQLLDAMLTEMRNKGLKVVVFFQTIGASGRGLTGEILDDFMRQRFGKSSFERIDRDVVATKKQSSMSRFNNEGERFVLLLETRACSNIIKISSVEAFILFDSSLNPLHDLRFIQKIKIESQSERTKIFRLYSSCTVEEKALLLASQNKSVAENPSPLVIHALLMWGASFLFEKLDHFHHNQTSESGVLFEQSIIEGVIDEISSIISPKDGDKKKGKQCLISEAKHVQGTYITASSLYGEEKVKLSDEDSPTTFWTKLLNQRSPTWRYCSVSLQRNRKRVRPLEKSEPGVGVESTGVSKRQKKANSDSSELRACHEEEKACGKDQNGALESPSSASGTDDMQANDALELYSLDGNISEIPEDMLACSDDRKRLCKSQKSLHAALKLDMANLCQVLHFSAEVTSIVENFLEYVISNHIVCKEPTTTLQAFHIAMCWVASTLLEQKINCEESLALAKNHLGYGCSREKVDYIYSMLYCLRGIFLKSQWGSRLDCLPKDPEQSAEDTSQIQVNSNMLGAATLREKKDTEKACGTESQACPSKRRCADYGSIRKDIDKSITDIRQKWSKQVKKLQKKHDEEKMELSRTYEKQKSDLEKSKKAKALVINIAWRAGSTQSKTDELKAMDHDFERKFDQLKSQMDESLKNLEEKHEAERKKLAENEADWIKRMGRWAEELLGLLNSKSEHCSGVIAANTCENGPDIAGTCEDPAGDASGCEERQEVMDPLAKAQNTVGTIIDNNSQLDVPGEVWNGQEDVLPITSSQHHTHDVVTESRSNGPTSATEPEISAAADYQEKVAVSNVFLSEDKEPDGVMPPTSDEDASLRVTAISQPLENSVSNDPPLDTEQALLSVGNNGASNLRAESAPIMDQQNEETCLLNLESHVVPVLPLEHSDPAVVSGGSATPDQATHLMCPPPLSSGGTQHDLAPNTESQNVEVAEKDTRQCEAAEPAVAELDLREVEAAEPSVAEPEAPEVEVAEPLRRSSNRDVVSQNAETFSRRAENFVEVAQEGVAEPSAGVAGEQPVTSQGRSMTNLNPIPQSSGQAAPQMPHAMPNDPFQYELEKIHREALTATKIHEDTKSQLKAEFERKVAELQREYDIKYHEADTKLQARAKELETYKNLIVMSKYLADAFNLKCSDPNAASTATLKDKSSDVTRRVAHQPTQGQAQRSYAAPPRLSVSSTAPPQTVPPISRPSVPPPQTVPPIPRPSVLTAPPIPCPSVLTAPPIPRPSVTPPQTVHPISRPSVPPPQTVPPIPRPAVLTVPPIPRPSVTPPQTAHPIPRPSVPPPQTDPPVPRPSLPPPQSQVTIASVPRSSVRPQRLSSMPWSRPPLITTTTPSSAVPTAVTAVRRSPAPHLQSYRPSSSANNVQRSPSPACLNSLPARVSRPEAVKESNSVSKPRVSATAEPTGPMYSSVVIQQQEQNPRGNSTTGFHCNTDVYEAQG